MTVIIGALELLGESVSPDKRNLLTLAENSAQHLLAIIDDLLDISRIEAHRLRIEEQPFDLRTCVGQVMAMFTLPAREKGLRLHWEVVPQLPAQVSGDSKRLGQILVNLVSNAVKFTESGGMVKVTVAGGEDGVLFSIRDTGIGMLTGMQK
jgi:signal transduction histidine kinase